MKTTIDAPTTANFDALTDRVAADEAEIAADKAAIADLATKVAALQPTPVPEPTPSPAPTPDPAPQPEPQPDPIPAPDPIPVPDPVPVPVPDPTPGPNNSVPLTARLDFADGKSLAFSETDAIDLGIYIGPALQQRCLRHIASGNGDYRDAFFVDFRPDADGKRDELVVEFGTLYAFPPGVQPKVASGVAPVNLFVPSPVKVAKTTGGTSAQAGVVDVRLTYVSQAGETIAGISPSVTLGAGELLVVPSPVTAGGATHYNVYATLRDVTPQNLDILQNPTPIPLGTPWTCPPTGLILTGKTPPPVSTISAYTLTIAGGNLADPVIVSVPTHPWATRHRWQSAPRPLVRSYDDLVAMRATLPLDKNLSLGAKLPPKTVWRGPMDNGGLKVAMSEVADRPDVGFITEWMAAGAITGDPSMEASWRANAEATGTMPYWIRDAATGALVDVRKAKYAAIGAGDASAPRYTIPVPPGGAIGQGIFALDYAHMPEAAHRASLLTDDPYWTEGAQAAANFSILWHNAQRINNKPGLPALAATSQVRALAWAWRDLFGQAGFAPENPPAWLLARGYWKSLLPDQLDYAMRFVNATASPCTTVFKFFIEVHRTPAFQLDYLMLALGWMKWSGLFPEFDPIVEYAATPRLAMSDPTDSYGWNHRYPEPYYAPVIDARKGALAKGVPASGYTVAASPYTPESWKELWDCFVAWAPTSRDEGVWPGDPSTWPADKLVKPPNAYSPLMMGSLAALSLAALPGARPAHDWMRGQLDPLSGKFPPARFKWAVKPE